MQFDIITLFPDFFTSPLQSGLLAKALERNIARVNLVNLRDFAHDKHRRVDDQPYPRISFSVGCLHAAADTFVII